MTVTTDTDTTATATDTGATTATDTTATDTGDWKLDEKQLRILESVQVPENIKKASLTYLLTKFKDCSNEWVSQYHETYHILFVVDTDHYDYKVLEKFEEIVKSMGYFSTIFDEENKYLIISWRKTNNINLTFKSKYNPV